MVLYVDCSEPVINHSGAAVFGNRVDLLRRQRNVKRACRISGWEMSGDKI